MVALPAASAEPPPGLAGGAGGGGGGDPAAADPRLPGQHHRAQAAGGAGPAPAAGAFRRCRQPTPTTATAGGGVLAGAASAALALRSVALETRLARCHAGTGLLERAAVRPGELGVRAGEHLAVGRPSGPRPQRWPGAVLGLVVATDPARLPAGGAPVVLVLSVHGVGGRSPSGWPAPWAGAPPPGLTATPTLGRRPAWRPASRRSCCGRSSAAWKTWPA